MAKSLSGSLFSRRSCEDTAMEFAAALALVPNCPQWADGSYSTPPSIGATR